jgi:MoaA/NifB/PqqE/SkfB family radical SAM enzyme
MSDTERAFDLEKAAAVQDWFRGAPRGPVSMELSPVMACNVNCMFCRRKDELPAYYKTEKDMTNERWFRIVADALELGTRRFLFRGGGEQTLRKRLFHSLFPLVPKYPGAEFMLLTNGTMIDERMAEGFVASGWNEITISLHGGTAETHDAIVDAPGSFAKIERALAAVNRFKRAQGRTLPGLSFHTVLTRLIYDKIDDVIELARKHDVHQVGIFPMHNPPYEQFVRDLTMRPEDKARYRALLPGYIKKLEGYGIQHCVQVTYQEENIEVSPQATTPLVEPARPAPEDGRLPEEARLPCYFPWSHTSITPNGALAPCCYGEGRQRKGDLNKVSFKEAWLGYDLGEYRELMKQGKLMEFCRLCPNWYQRDNHRLREILKDKALQANGRAV